MEFSLICSHCRREGRVKKLCICSTCRGRTYHKTCWPVAPLHLPSDGYADVCKQPTNFVEYIWIHYLVRSQTVGEEQAALHRKDMWSSWFNVPNQQDRAHLYVYPRLESLINNAQGLREDSKAFEQFPSLVSFFGETGYVPSILFSVAHFLCCTLFTRGTRLGGLCTYC